MLRHTGHPVKRPLGVGFRFLVEWPSEVFMTAKLILRNQEYEVRAGMTLLDALKKSDIVPEGVIAVREGQLIVDDEILRNGDVIKLVSVISGG
jgi:sulfur carrier protein ThiS